MQEPGLGAMAISVNALPPSPSRTIFVALYMSGTVDSGITAMVLALRNRRNYCRHWPLLSIVLAHRPGFVGGFCWRKIWHQAWSTAAAAPNDVNFRGWGHYRDIWLEQGTTARIRDQVVREQRSFGPRSRHPSLPSALFSSLSAGSFTSRLP